MEAFKLLNNKPRVYGLDILRCVAITYVMFSHGFVYSGKVVSVDYYKWLIVDGVALFFVLSGFLIGGILIKQIESGTFGLKELRVFWTRRWLRTLPPYYCVLILLIGLYYISHAELPPEWQNYFLFVQNFASAHPLFFREAWSLAVEEWFYLLIPLAFYILVKLKTEKRRLILLSSLFFIVLITVFRFYKIQQHDYFNDGSFSDDILKVVITRLDAIMYGVLGAWVLFYFPSGFYKYKTPLLAAGVILLIASNALFTPFMYTLINPSLIPFATLCLLPALSALKEGKGPVYHLVTFISIISYSMYLTNHMIVQRGIMPFIIKGLSLDAANNSIHNSLLVLLFWVLTIASAYLLHVMVEKPFMLLRKRSA